MPFCNVECLMQVNRSNFHCDGNDQPTHHVVLELEIIAIPCFTSKARISVILRISAQLGSHSTTDLLAHRDHLDRHLEYHLHCRPHVRQAPLLDWDRHLCPQEYCLDWQPQTFSLTFLAPNSRFVRVVRLLWIFSMSEGNGTGRINSFITFRLSHPLAFTGKKWAKLPKRSIAGLVPKFHISELSWCPLDRLAAASRCHAVCLTVCQIRVPAGCPARAGVQLSGSPGATSVLHGLSPALIILRNET